MTSTGTIILKGQPISTNNCYFHLRTGIRIMTPKARALKEDYIWQVKSQWKDKPLEGDLEIEVNIFYGNKRKYDWDNLHKLSIDSMTGIVFIDDSQIQKATVIKGYDKDNPCLEIRVKVIHRLPFSVLAYIRSTVYYVYITDNNNYMEFTIEQIEKIGKDLEKAGYIPTVELLVEKLHALEKNAEEIEESDNYDLATAHLA